MGDITHLIDCPLSTARFTATMANKMQEKRTFGIQFDPHRQCIGLDSVPGRIIAMLLPSDLYDG